MNKKIVDYVYITIGTFLLALSVITFWQPHNMVTGGISGLAIVLFYYTESAGFQIPVPIWATNLVLNLPLFIIGYKIVPKEYLVRSVYSYFILTLSLFVLQFVPAFPSDMLTAAVFGGVVAGIGIGFVFRSRATTGGTTLIAAIIHKWALPHISMAKILFCVDSSIIIVGLVMFGPVYTMYAIMAVFVVAKITDITIEGLAFSKAAFIISQKADDIADSITQDLNRGCTELPSRGRYSRQEQTTLLCVVKPKEIVGLKQLVYAIDDKAFVIVTDVREVLGEGFKTGE